MGEGGEDDETKYTVYDTTETHDTKENSITKWKIFFSKVQEGKQTKYTIERYDKTTKDNRTDK